MLEAEMNEHIGYEKYQHSDGTNYRNGTKKKNVCSTYGEFQVDIPQDRNSTFDPKIVKKLVFYDRILKIIGGYFYEREKRSLQSKTIN